MAGTDDERPPDGAGEDRDPEEIAAEILETAIHDHRYCANCFKQIREIEPPGMRSGGKRPPDFAIGFAYPTKETVEAVGEVLSPQDPVGDDWEYTPVVDGFTQRRICDCGATQHRTQEQTYSTERAIERAKNLSETIDELREEYYAGSAAEVVKARQWAHSRDALLDVLRSLKAKPKLQYRDHDILERALKLAIKHPNYTTSD